MSLSQAQMVTLLHAAAASFEREQDRLSELDGAIGDGDHGVTMAIGWRAVDKALDGLDGSESVKAISNTVAKAFLNAVGASAGPLYATVFMRGGAAVGDVEALDARALADYFEAGLEGLKARGKAEAGDKTMLDAWIPAVTALRESADGGADVAAALFAAADGAQSGAEATRDMEAKKGRASKLGGRSVGHMDPGAASTAVLFRALADAAAELPA